MIVEKDRPKYRLDPKYNKQISLCIERPVKNWTTTRSVDENLIIFKIDFLQLGFL